MDIQKLRFQTLDYIIFAISILVSIAIGVFYALCGGRQRTTTEYHLGDRKMMVLPVAISLLVSFQSAILLLGFPAEMYNYGPQYWLFTLSVISANTISAVLFAPLFQPLGITSAYEYLQMRFNSRMVRLLASLLAILSSLWYNAIVLYGPAITLQVVTGFPIVQSIVVVGVSGVVYTAMGGIKAVIWTDAVQFVIMLAGMLAVLIQACIEVGGIETAMDICSKNGRLDFFNFNPDPTVRLTFWAVIVGGTIKKIGFCLSQAGVQRMSTMPTVSKARCMILWAIPGFVLFGTLACLQGLVAYAYFEERQCDPLQKGLIKSQNQLIPYFVMILFYKKPGLPGLFLSSIFSASLSTYSSNLNCISAQVWEDFLKSRYPFITQIRATFVCKVIVLIFGALSIGLSFVIIYVPGPLTQITSSILSSFGSALTGLFLLGALFRISNKYGALIGTVVGFGFIFWISMGFNFSNLVPKATKLPSPGISGCPGNYTPFHNMTYITEKTHMTEDSTTPALLHITSNITAKATGIGKLYSVSFMWFDTLGVLTTLFVGLIVSLITYEKGTEVDPKLLIPVLKRFCPCFGQSKTWNVNDSMPNSNEMLLDGSLSHANSINQSSDPDRVHELSNSHLPPTANYGSVLLTKNC